MKVLSFILVFSLLLLQSCAKPKATVFLDQSLAQEERVKFCFTGDMGKDTPHQLAIAEALRREDCHRIFFLGDLVYPKGITSLEDTEFTEKFLAYYLPLLEDDPDLVISMILGNHDHKGEPSAWKKISDVHPRLFFPNYYYMLDYGGLCLVALDSSFYYYFNEIGETAEQTAWIQSLQSRLKKCDVKVAMTHHPFKGKGYDSEDDWEGPSAPLKAFLDTYVVGVFDIHLAGHVHVVVNDGKDEGTHMLISGAGGETRAGNKAGYIVLSWEPGNPKRVGYALKEIDVIPNVIDESASIQKEEEEEEPEWLISRPGVELGLFAALWARLRNFFD